LSYELRDEAGFVVMGIRARVSNATPERIGDLCRRFHSLGDTQCVKGRLNDAGYCVYCEYEGDYTQEFTVVIGCAVPANTVIAEGMKKIEIAAGRFAVLQVTGKLPQGVFEAWGEVWKAPLDRRYQADFDRYGTDGVSVHAGVR
jgi:predicted transcriptional regulator YdeE